MENNLIIDDLKLNLGQSIKIAANCYIFEDYKIICHDTELIDKEKYYEQIVDEDPVAIIGINNDDRATLKNLTFSDFDILFSLLELIDKPLPDPKEVSWFHNENIKDLVPLENIMTWVEKYGLPFDKINKDFIDKNIKNSYFIEEKNIEKAGFSIATFRRILVMLKARFVIWHAIVYEDQKTLDKFKFLIDIIVGPENKKNLNFKNILLRTLFNSNYNIKPEYDSEKDKYLLMIYASSLIEVAEFQFYNLLTKGFDYNKKHIKICKYCNNYFWTNDDRQIFCKPKCRKNHWYHENK
jgi:hypothetical protein